MATYSYVLVTVYDHEIEIDTFETEEAAQQALMRDVLETFGPEIFDDLPDTYEPAKISDAIASYGASYLWKIEVTA